MRPERKWQFNTRFRRHAFGSKSQPAIKRVRQAVTEITQVARNEPIEAGEGAVTFIERLSPALENVDSPSGAIGTAVDNAIAELVPIIVEAPADPTTRAAWLERVFDAHQADKIPYIEQLADNWGELCGSTELASEWADRLVGVTRMALSPDKNIRGCFHGTSACLSALLAAALPQKWFAAAKEANLFDEAIALAKQTPCDPRTLTRAARDFAEKNPTFATEAGMAALYWLIRGHGYEITSADVWAAWSTTMRAARNAGGGDEVRARICSACGRRAAAQRLRRRDCHALRRGRGSAMRSLLDRQIFSRRSSRHVALG